jgi:D-tyrosyl-tRNA(Tyr) deacylase
MKAVIQRVKEASVTVEGERIAAIGPGMLVLLGVEKGDTDAQLNYLADKLVKLRIFSDEQGKMNRSVLDMGGSMLVVSQFTLAGNCLKGNRPGFDAAMPPAEAEAMYEQFLGLLRAVPNLDVQAGRFGADMQVGLINDGPVTFIVSPP